MRSINFILIFTIVNITFLLHSHIDSVAIRKSNRFNNRHLKSTVTSPSTTQEIVTVEKYPKVWVGKKGIVLSRF